ncbi:MAG: hypothetical protein DHS80DRAFT_22606 [Piptocephalis tieghemiana]|nr:MAG: hypothetical protein DHS80DRAFT_22606 [Piptocephalis tieghemiana]
MAKTLFWDIYNPPDVPSKAADMYMAKGPRKSMEVNTAVNSIPYGSHYKLIYFINNIDKQGVGFEPMLLFRTNDLLIDKYLRTIPWNLMSSAESQGTSSDSSSSRFTRSRSSSIRSLTRRSFVGTLEDSNQFQSRGPSPRSDSPSSYYSARSDSSLSSDESSYIPSRSSSPDDYFLLHGSLSPDESFILSRSPSPDQSSSITSHSSPDEFRPLSPGGDSIFSDVSSFSARSTEFPLIHWLPSNADVRQRYVLSMEKLRAIVMYTPESLESFLIRLESVFSNNAEAKVGEAYQESFIDLLKLMGRGHLDTIHKLLNSPDGTIQHWAFEQITLKLGDIANNLHKVVEKVNDVWRKAIERSTHAPVPPSSPSTERLFVFKLSKLKLFRKGNQSKAASVVNQNEQPSRPLFSHLFKGMENQIGRMQVMAYYLKCYVESASYQVDEMGRWKDRDASDQSNFQEAFKQMVMNVFILLRGFSSVLLAQAFHSLWLDGPLGAHLEEGTHQIIQDMVKGNRAYAKAGDVIQDGKNVAKLVGKNVQRITLSNAFPHCKSLLVDKKTNGPFPTTYQNVRLVGYLMSLVHTYGQNIDQAPSRTLEEVLEKKRKPMSWFSRVMDEKTVSWFSKVTDEINQAKRMATNHSIAGKLNKIVGVMKKMKGRLINLVNEWENVHEGNLFNGDLPSRYQEHELLKASEATYSSCVSLFRSIKDYIRDILPQTKDWDMCLKEEIPMRHNHKIATGHDQVNDGSSPQRTKQEGIRRKLSMGLPRMGRKSSVGHMGQSSSS